MQNIVFWSWILVWFAWAAQALLSVMQVRKMAQRFGREPAGDFWNYTPHVDLIIPFKGIDADLPGCIRSLCTQNYPDYCLVLVVESEQDPAYPLLKSELAAYPQRRAVVLVAGQAGPEEGQKVHNQLCVLKRLEKESCDKDVWVFADSDAVPGPDWLMNLVGPLHDHSPEPYGLTTGYRWFIPDESSGRSLLDRWATRLLSVMNSSVACVYRQRQTSRAWGGAMAIRVATARQGGLTNYLRHSLSDDYQMTHMIRSMDQRIWFVPRCLVASPAHFTFGTMFDFARRQYLITKIYTPWSYYGALGVMGFWAVGFLGSVGWLTVGWWLDLPSMWVPALTAMALVFLLNQLRHHYRRTVVRNAFGPDMLLKLQPTLYIDRWFTPVWMLIHLAIILSALLGRTIRWRGVRYQLWGPQQIRATRD